MSNSADNSSDLNSGPGDTGDDVVDLTDEVDSGETSGQPDAEAEQQLPDDSGELPYDRTAEMEAVDRDEVQDTEADGGSSDQSGTSGGDSPALPEAGMETIDLEDEVPNAAVVTPRDETANVEVDESSQTVSESQAEARARSEEGAGAEVDDSPDVDAPTETVDRPLPSDSSAADDRDDPDGAAPEVSEPDDGGAARPPGPDNDGVTQTVRMEAVDRGAIEREGQYQQLKQTLPLVSSRFGSEIVVQPPRVLVTRWREGLPDDDGEADAKRSSSSPPAKPRTPSRSREKSPPPARDDGGGASPPDITPSKRSGPTDDDQTSTDDGGRTRKATPSGPPARSSPPPVDQVKSSSGPPDKPPPPDEAGSGSRPSPPTDEDGSGGGGNQTSDSGQREAPSPPPRNNRTTAPQTPRAKGESAPPRPEPTSARPESADDEIDNLVDDIIEDDTDFGLAEPTGPPDDGQWVQRVFGEEFLLTLPPGIQQRTVDEVDFFEKTFEPADGARILDLGCGWGRHTIEMSKRGYSVVGFDLSKPLLQRAVTEANRLSLDINFFHGDMRSIDFDGVFDYLVSWETSFGYFDDATNRDVLGRMFRALNSGGQLLLDVANRDSLVQDMPHREWWEGSECLFLEEGEFDYRTSLFHMNRSFIFEDGRPPIEHDYYIRIYALHELRRLLKGVGFEIRRISGDIHYPGYFLGAESPRLIVEARKP